jgi:hypothetical protein
MWRAVRLAGVLSPCPLVSHSTTELTRGNRKSQFHEFTGKLTSNVDFYYLSRSQWLQLEFRTPFERAHLERFNDLCTENGSRQGQNLALAGLFVPSSLDSASPAGIPTPLTIQVP